MKTWSVISNSLIRLFLTISALMQLLLINSAYSADGTWDGGGSQAWGEAIWGGVNNWDPNGAVASGAGYTAYFGKAFANGYAVIVNTERTIGNIVYNDPTNANDFIIRKHANDYTLTLDNLGKPAVINVTQEGRTLTINCRVGGTGGLKKTGPGILILNTNNTISGPTIIEAGILALGHSLALKNSVLDTTNSVIGDITNGLRTLVTNITLGGLAGDKDLASIFTTTAGGFDTVTELTLNPIAGVIAEYSGTISDGAPGMTLVKTGAGTQILSGTNTYTGPTIINGGLLAVKGGSIPTHVTVNSGGGLGAYGPGTVPSIEFTSIGFMSFDVVNGGQLTVLNPNGITNSGGAASIIINITGETPLPGTYTLINYSGSIQGSGFSAYKFGSGPEGAEYELTDTGSAVQLVVKPDTTPPTIVSALGLLLATNLPPQKPYTLTDILITFSEPVDPVTAEDIWNYEVYETANPSSALSVVAAYMLSPSNVLLRTFEPRKYLVNYTIKVNNILDRAPLQPNPILPDTTFNIWHELSLITFTDDDIFAPTNAWKYSDQNIDYGPYWYTNSADFFAGWMDGWQLFAAKSSGSGMPSTIPELVRTQMTPVDILRTRTYYFWRTFEFPTGVNPQFAELRLRYIVDDGAVFYLNKKEWYAIGMPTNRPIYFTNLATRTMGDAPYEPPTNAAAVIQPYYVVPNDNLKQGINEIAVEVHQVNDTSSDAYFGMILTAVVPPIGQAVKPWIVEGPYPTNTVLPQGATFTLNVEALGTPPLFYSWYFVKTNTTTWTQITGQNTSTLTINNVTTNNNGAYYVVVANSQGAVTSTPAYLTVLLPPVITNQPVSVTTNVGATVTFSVGATGVPPLSYQWYWNMTPISGANSATLTLQNVKAYQAGEYYVVVSNVGGSTTSQVAQLILPPDTTRPTVLMALGLLRATNYPPTQPPTYTDILITFSEPVDPVTATNIANYRVDRYGGGQNLPVARAIMIGESNVLLTTSVPRTLYTNYTLTINNVTDYSPNRNPIVPNTQFDIYLELPLIYFGPTNDLAYAWKFDYSGTDYSGQFYLPEFDDSAWTNCWMLFEGKRGTVPALPEPIGTLLPTVTTDPYIITYYFRKHFYFPPGINPQHAELRLRYVIDDAAIFYMNGHEFHSVRMPATPRPMTWSTLGSGSAVGDATYEPATNPDAVIQPYYVVTNAYLKNGDNVIAVEVHQIGTGSSDITFGMILTAVVPPIGQVVTPPTVEVSPPVIANNKIRISFATESGWTYYLESTPGLEVQTLNWGVVTSVQGDGTVKTLQDNVVGGRKFYRVRAVKQ